jgi:hypothetical protein
VRVLLIGSHRTERIERGVERAMRRAGHITRLVDDRRLRRKIGLRLTQRWVLAVARRFRPDFVFFSKALGLTLETVAALTDDHPSSLWYQDPQWYRDVHLRHVAHSVSVGRLVDTFYVTGFEAQWQALGLNAKLLPSAADIDICPVPPDADYAADVSFIGTGPGVSHGGSGFAPERAEYLAELASILGSDVRVRVWGDGWEAYRDRLEWGGRPVFGRDLSRVCSSSAIVLGINPARAAGATLYTSDRIWMMMLGGGFYLGRRTSGLDRLLIEGEHCAWYDDLDECVAQIRRYLADPQDRNRVRVAGERIVRERHTFDNRVQYLVTGEDWRE